MVMSEGVAVPVLVTNAEVACPEHGLSSEVYGTVKRKPSVVSVVIPPHDVPPAQPTAPSDEIAALAAKT